MLVKYLSKLGQTPAAGAVYVAVNPLENVKCLILLFNMKCWTCREASSIHTGLHYTAFIL